MTPPLWLTLCVSFVTDFIITGGTGIYTAMAATGTLAMPTRAVVLGAAIGGLMAGARRIQALFAPPPGSVVPPPAGSIGGTP